MKSNQGLEYTSTNESLDSVVQGLDVNSEDRILAVGGSGDQAFALLEKAGSVTVVDRNPAQIWYVRQRAELINHRDYEMFLALIRGRIPQEYFRRDGILEKLKERIDSLDILEPCDILEVDITEGRFTKVYLSNSIGYDEQEIAPEVRDSLRRMANNLPINGLIYSAWSLDETFGIKQPSLKAVVRNWLSALHQQDSKENDDNLPVGINRDEELTKIAGQYEGKHSDYSSATVYRMIKPQIPS